MQWCRDKSRNPKTKRPIMRNSANGLYPKLALLYKKMMAKLNSPTYNSSMSEIDAENKLMTRVMKAIQGCKPTSPSVSEYLAVFGDDRVYKKQVDAFINNLLTYSQGVTKIKIVCENKNVPAMTYVVTPLSKPELLRLLYVSFRYTVHIGKNTIELGLSPSIEKKYIQYRDL